LLAGKAVLQSRIFLIVDCESGGRLYAVRTGSAEKD
jgi:hypothetical protein